LYTYHHPFPLDEACIVELAPLFVGEHDFSAFAAADEKYEAGASGAYSMRRTVYASLAERSGDLLVYRVRGNGFLKHMVRNIVGVLLEAGKGNFSRADVEARLAAGSGISPGPAVPGRGLFLIGVEY
jgi:tRNA pseudouridine38-40 synthase